MAQANRKILVDALFADLLKEVDYPDFDELAHERYLTNPADYTTPEKRKAAHILLTDKNRDACSGDPEITPDALIAMLDDGADFGLLAKQYSQDKGTAEQGGVLNQWITRNDRAFVKAFIKGLFAIDAEAGVEISQPVQTRYGVHIIKLMEREPGRLLSFEEVKPKIITQLREQYRQSLLSEKRSLSYPEVSSMNIEALENLLKEMTDAKQTLTSPLIQ
jgi:peptidyl-prolyl cis-trans isomerase C